MDKNNKNPTKSTEISYESIKNIINLEDFDLILEMKSRFYSPGDWHTEILSKNFFRLRDLLIQKGKCPYCLEDLQYKTETNNHGDNKEPMIESYGYYYCLNHGEDIY